MPYWLPINSVTKSLLCPFNETGCIPQEISAVTSLQYLQLSGNRFSGYLPKTFGSLIALKFFDISNNELSGSIPNSFSLLSNLSEISLYNNYLRGFPSVIKSLPELRALIVNNNYFEGNLQSVIDFDGIVQKDLSLVDVSNNAFTGKLPLLGPFYGPSLLLLDASGNCLQG